MGTVKEDLTVGAGFSDEIAWLREAARYFRNRPTNGEDRAHWANVYNAQNADNLADRLSSGTAPQDKDDRNFLRAFIGRALHGGHAKQ